MMLVGARHGVSVGEVVNDYKPEVSTSFPQNPFIDECMKGAEPSKNFCPVFEFDNGHTVRRIHSFNGIGVIQHS